MERPEKSKYDFIIVGAGASGAVLASRIAHTPASPSVLLIEAGSPNADAAHLNGAERFNVAFAPNSHMNWGYKTVPQHQLTGQEIDYSRGKGLGGSTAINFCGWTVGPRDDYDEWADIVGDKRFGWENVNRVLKRIENLDTRIPDPRLRDRLSPRAGDHSVSGNVNLSYGDAWVPEIGDIFVAAEESGHGINPDVNDGDPIGMGIGSVCIANEVRETSVSAYLSNPPPNLTIVTDSPIARVLFHGKVRAVGVETIDGRKFIAEKEVILSCGAINTPQVLMLSGIGPAAELRRHGIEVIRDMPLVGQNLQDHCFSAAGIVLEKETSIPPTGPPSQSPTPMGWFKLPSLTSSPEFQALPARIQDHMQKPTVPAIELAAHAPTAFLGEAPSTFENPFASICLLMNPQSRGTITLRSSNPSEAPIVDPKFLTHPFDKCALIQGVREVMRILSAPVYSSRTLRKAGPVDDSDDAIWKHIKGNLHSSWHMSGTAKMGPNESEAVVDSRFNVFGVERLRVVDMSACPFVINAHIQAAAYIVGEIAAEVLAEEYDLGEVTISGRRKDAAGISKEKL